MLTCVRLHVCALASFQLISSSANNPCILGHGTGKTTIQNEKYSFKMREREYRIVISYIYELNISQKYACECDITDRRSTTLFIYYSICFLFIFKSKLHFIDYLIVEIINRARILFSIFFSLKIKLP